MITISLCMIVKDEEQTIERVLTSAKEIADEIIIVDTGSTDNTKALAAKFTDKIYDFEWCNDFSKARNYSFSKATCDYCMWLDADDVILEADVIKILTLKETLDPDISIVMMKYHISFDENDNPTFTFYRERLLRRKDNFQWGGFVHEAIASAGKQIYSDIAIYHRKIKQDTSTRNIDIFESKKKEGIVFTPRELFYYARELYYHKRYNEAIDVFQNFLDTKLGWKENCISAHQFIGYCYDVLGNKQKAIEEMFLTFKYDAPRAEICCDLGKYYFQLKNYHASIYWYKSALLCTRDDTSGAFVLVDCYDFIPYLELCVCYYYLGDFETSHTFNELAGQLKKNHPSYLYNKACIAEKIKQNN